MVNKKKIKYKKYLFILILLIPIFYNSSKMDNNAHIEVSNNDANIEETIDKNDWRLILVNKQNTLPDNFSVNLKNINSTHKVDERIYDDLINMLNDAKNQNIDLLIVSSYRSKETSDQLYSQKVQ